LLSFSAEVRMIRTLATIAATALIVAVTAAIVR
jgi:hypothetical protein